MSPNYPESLFLNAETTLISKRKNPNKTIARSSFRFPVEG